MSRYLVILFAFSWIGCVKIEWPTIKETPLTELYPPQTLLDLPTPSHDREVEVFFSSVSVPSRPFLQLKYITKTLRGDENIHPVVLKFKETAQKLGADGIVITNVNKWIHDGWLGDIPYSSLQTDIEAVFFVYPDSLKFHEKNLKAWTMYTHDPVEDKWVESGKINYAMGGNPVGKEGDTTRLDWWHERSMDRLVTNKRVVGFPLKDDKGKERAYTLVAYLSRVHLFYRIDDLISLIQYKRFNGETEQIRLVYDEDNRIIQRVISSPLEEFDWIENWEYTASGEINGFKFYQLMRDHHANHFYIKPSFYTYREWEQHKNKIIESELGTLSDLIKE